MSSYQTIIYEQADGCARLVLNRPQALNAVDPTMLEEIGAAVKAAEADEAVRVLILTGAGERAFCAGMDLRAFSSLMADMTPLQRRATRRGYRHPIATLSKPVIGAINGLAYGGGLELSLLCDIVIAADHATFAAAEVQRALIPGNGATQRLPRKVGLAAAMEMLLTGQPIDANKALAIGLVNRVVPAASLPAATAEMAQILVANAPLALRMIKEAALRGLDLPLEKGLALETDLVTLIQGTSDAKEGVRAFIEKRKPVWTGS